jgi:hypothetical protein
MFVKPIAMNFALTKPFLRFFVERSFKRALLQSEKLPGTFQEACQAVNKEAQNKKHSFLW